MDFNFNRRVGIFLIAVLLLLIADQVTKYLIIHAIELNSGFEAVSGLLTIVHIRNPGAAFGMFANSSSHLRSDFFIILSVLAIASLTAFVFFSKNLNVWSTLGASFFVGGALGNLIDRFRFGEVVDFLYFHLGSYYWPAFNVADAALCCGTAFFLISYFKDRSNNDLP